MGNFIRICECTCIEGQSPYLRARIEQADGTPVVQADFGAINWYVYGENDELLSSGACVVVDTITDALQAWDLDTDGYNFSMRMEAADLTISGRTSYWVEIVFSLLLPDENIAVALYHLYQLPIRSV